MTGAVVTPVVVVGRCAHDCGQARHAALLGLYAVGGVAALGLAWLLLAPVLDWLRERRHRRRGW